MLARFTRRPVKRVEKHFHAQLQWNDLDKLQATIVDWITLVGPQSFHFVTYTIKKTGPHLYLKIRFDSEEQVDDTPPPTPPPTSPPVREDVTPPPDGEDAPAERQSSIEKEEPEPEPTPPPPPPPPRAQSPKKTQPSSSPKAKSPKEKPPRFLVTAREKCVGCGEDDDFGHDLVLFTPYLSWEPAKNKTKTNKGIQTSFIRREIRKARGQD